MLTPAGLEITKGQAFVHKMPQLYLEVQLIMELFSIFCNASTTGTYLISIVRRSLAASDTLYPNDLKSVSMLRHTVLASASDTA